jgi:hypothetical protein
MPTTDRRQTSRTKLDQLAYINIEPDNGGIVLNVSGEGLAFHSMAPVERNGTLRLALQEQNRRIDVCGELVWTDEVQRSGGVRFTNLPAEARDQLLKWTRNSDTAARNTLGSVLLRALPGTDSRRVARSLTPVLAWWKSGTRLKLSGFNRGLATGLLVSLVAFSIVLFSYGHRHEFGESLIRLGKRLAGDSDRTPRPVPPSSVTVSSPPTAPAITTVDARSSLDKAPAVKTAPERKSTYAEARPVVQTPVPPAPRHTEDPPKQPNPGADKTRVANLSGGKGPAPQTTLPTLATAKPANSGPLQSPISHAPASIAKQQLAPSMDSEAAVTLSAGPSLQSPGSNVQMFYDLGRFKKEELAQILSDKLAQLGMHAAVVHRRNLWMTAYQVLVGPYDNEVAERQISNELLSHGYKPRPFERGTRNFAFRSKLTIDRSQLPTGDFTIAWESYIADAKVRFKQGNSEIAAVDGKWIKRQTKFSHNEYVYRIQADGARPLLEVHFAGMDRALVFRNLP